PKGCSTEGMAGTAAAEATSLGPPRLYRRPGLSPFFATLARLGPRRAGRRRRGSRPGVGWGGRRVQVRVGEGVGRHLFPTDIGAAETRAARRSSSCPLPQRRAVCAEVLKPLAPRDRPPHAVVVFVVGRPAKKADGEDGQRHRGRRRTTGRASTPKRMRWLSAKKALVKSGEVAAAERTRPNSVGTAGFAGVGRDKPFRGAKPRPPFGTSARGSGDAAGKGGRFRPADLNGQARCGGALVLGQEILLTSFGSDQHAGGDGGAAQVGKVTRRRRKGDRLVIGKAASKEGRGDRLVIGRLVLASNALAKW